MADDLLDQADALRFGFGAAAAAAQAAGAQAPTLAGRLFLPFDVGQLVKDPVTGQYGVVLHVSLQSSQPARA